MDDFIPFLTALLVAGILTPPVKRWAVVIGAVDHPAERKIHREPMPRLGGMAVYAGFWTGVLVYGGLHPGVLPAAVAGIFMGSLSLVLLGVYDDIGDAPVRIKFPVQIAAAHLAYFFGVRFDLLPGIAAFAGITLPEPLVSFTAYALTILWIVGITNAINFMDGLDGLAGGISLSASISLLLIAQLCDAAEMVPFVGALAGALLGFMPFNRFPASIFLGDTGSTFLGFALANFTLLTCHRPEASFGARLIPMLLLAVPLSDILYAILRRAAAGANVFGADRGHVHHRLLAAGYSPRDAAGLLLLASLCSCLASLILVDATPGTVAAVVLVVAALDVVVAIRLELFARRVIEAGAPGPSS